MEELTYEMYLANLAMRDQIVREARRARAEALHQFVVAPLARMIARSFTSARPTMQSVFPSQRIRLSPFSARQGLAPGSYVHTRTRAPRDSGGR